MVRGKKQTTSKPSEQAPTKASFHAFWSGALSFGLVNVPVMVLPASRNSGVRLRMIGPNGSLLERRFFCPSEDNELSDNEIVRGYELDDGSYITIEDEELEALEPKKTREIDLRAFVDLSELPIALMERGYYLAPTADSTKAYRLLAEVLERTERAGIGTFVMRDREYVIAIFAKGGILHAETLRFHDEIRKVEEVGLPALEKASPVRVAAFERSIKALHSNSLSPTDLADRSTEALKALVEKKKKAGRGLIRSEPDADQSDGADASETDLLETIRRSLESPPKRSAKVAKTAARGQTPVKKTNARAKANPQNRPAAGKVQIKRKSKAKRTRSAPR